VQKCVTPALGTSTGVLESATPEVGKSSCLESIHLLHARYIVVLVWTQYAEWRVEFVAWAADHVRNGG
jgi:hypothetical protein